MQAVIELVSRVRNIRTELGVKPSEEVRLVVAASDGLGEVFKANAAQVRRLTRASDISVKDSMAGVPRASARAALGGGAEVAVPLEGLIDFEQERARIEREREKVAKELEKIEAQLANPQFVERAPAQKVDELRQRAAEIGQRIGAFEQMLEALGE
jgi:valyl-tRNA synthetase